MVLELHILSPHIHARHQHQVPCMLPRATMHVNHSRPGTVKELQVFAAASDCTC